MRIVFVLLFLSVVLGGYFYVFYRLWQMMPPNLIGRILLVGAAVLFILSLVLSFVGRDFLPMGFAAFGYKLSTSWLIMFLYLILLFLVLDLLRVTHLIPVERFMYNSWIGFGSVFATIGLLLSIGYYRYIHKERVELTIPIKKELTLEGKKNLKIVAISDLHIGFNIGKKELESWVDLINKEEPDLVLIAGDIIDNSVKPLFAEDMASPFYQIKSRLGVYTIMGNHEYIANATEATAFLEAAGLTLLKDSVALVNDSFYIIGRDDRSNPNRKSIEELTASLDKTKPLLLLDHQPLHLEEAEKNGIDLQISGHTHGGQVWPITLVTKAMFEIDHGYLQKGNSHFYVSSGLGIWGGKFRIGSQSEYVVINLQSE